MHSQRTVLCALPLNLRVDSHDVNRIVTEFRGATIVVPYGSVAKKILFLVFCFIHCLNSSLVGPIIHVPSLRCCNTAVVELQAIFCSALKRLHQRPLDSGGSHSDTVWTVMCETSGFFLCICRWFDNAQRRRRYTLCE